MAWFPAMRAAGWRVRKWRDAVRLRMPFVMSFVIRGG